MHLVGFTIQIYYDERLYDHHINVNMFQFAFLVYLFSKT